MAGPRSTVTPFRRPARTWVRASELAPAARSRRPRGAPWWRQVSPIMVMAPLAAFTAVFLWGGPSEGFDWPAGAPRETSAAPIGASEAELRQRRWPTSAADLDAAQPSFAAGALGEAPGMADSAGARFTLCGGGARVNCVVDGDTFWYAGEKIRVADINTPETSEPQCAREAALGRAATGRMQALLNAGPFTLERVDRERDAYGRLLRTVTRGGESLGAVLVREGLAEEWRGRRGSWC